MSEFKHKEGNGSLFKNDRKEKDTHPDMRGTINIGGEIKSIAAWTKEGKKGKFLSVKISDMQKVRKDDLGQQDDLDSLPF